MIDLEIPVRAWLCALAVLIASAFVALAASAQTISTVEGSGKPGTNRGRLLTIQGDPLGTPVPISGTINSAGAADTVGSTVAFNANSVCAQVSTAGQVGAGFFLGAGTLTGTLTPSVSKDNANWTATSFVDINGNTSATAVLASPNAFYVAGLKMQAGDRYARVCATAFTSGAASGFLVATTVQPPPPAAGADVTDRAGRLLGIVYGSDGNKLATANTGRLQVDIISGGGSNASVGATAAAVPVSATYAGMNVAGNLTGLTGTTNGLKVDGSAVTQPISGTITLGTDSVGLAKDTKFLDDAAATSAASESGTGRLATFAGLRLLDTTQVAGSQLVTAKGDQTSGLWVNVRAAPTTTVTGTVTANIGTSGSLALDATVGKLNVAQAAALGSNTGPLVQGSVTTAAPAYTTGNINPLSLNTSGGLRVDGSGVTQPVSGTFWQATQPVSGTVTSNQGTAAALSGAWPTKPTDGTNAITIKAASTAPATTDTALVVAQSPQPVTICTSTLAVSQTASTDIKTSTNKLHICSIVLVSATAQSIALVEGTGTTCATGIAAIIGSTTAANGPALAANGGFSAVSDRPWLKTATTADHLCLLQSGTGLVAGVITYADAP